MQTDAVEFESGGHAIDAELRRPDDVESPPVVVMAHGFGAERDFRLPAYADRFVDRGVTALLFDYRGFGDSEGPNQLVDPFRHRADWLAAVDHARTLDGVDGDRLALWGTSFSTGHVVETAARRDVEAVLGQVPFVDGCGRSSTWRAPPASTIPSSPRSTASRTPRGASSVGRRTPSPLSGRPTSSRC